MKQIKGFRVSKRVSSRLTIADIFYKYLNIDIYSKRNIQAHLLQLKTIESIQELLRILKNNPNWSILEIIKIVDIDLFKYQKVNL